MGHDKTTRAQPQTATSAQAGPSRDATRGDSLRHELRGLDHAAGEARLVPPQPYTGVVIDPGIFSARLDWPFNVHRDMIDGSISAGDPVRVADPTRKNPKNTRIAVDAESACHLGNPKTFSKRAEANAHAGKNPFVIDEDRMHDISYQPGRLQLFLKAGVRKELAAADAQDKVSSRVALVVDALE
ncbi:MAG TPA: hypothetical protein PK095_11275 [Myxococcota bacterium]|nr:hypothetical protein [Myxococcota bacterium]